MVKDTYIAPLFESLIDRLDLSASFGEEEDSLKKLVKSAGRMFWVSAKSSISLALALQSFYAKDLSQELLQRGLQKLEAEIEGLIVCFKKEMNIILTGFGITKERESIINALVQDLLTLKLSNQKESNLN